jgi:DNA invertase Pin-like site-specific DNA recombinase/DNA-binding winged helix-turn-helix (wHTH) protein
MPAQALTPAAEYVRMSTDDQPNSIFFQTEAIRRYAATHGFEVVATYSDPGKSGVEIKHRPGLQKLIQDVVGGEVKFSAIIVYDVSRWGRFQDTDEAACYEFLCRKAGVPIHYCAEQFANDFTMSNTIAKALKRTMAAEFSRELGAKVAAAQRLIAANGFRVGGTPGYGFRRMVISADGRKKQILDADERKNLRSDHVVLVPGPRHEVESIRNIFALAADKRNTPLRIAKELNRRGLTFIGGKPWNESNIYRILKNEKYMGEQAWGKTHKLRVCPPENWIRKTKAFSPLVTPVQFSKVQRAIQQRNNWPKRPDEVLIKEMKQVLRAEGRLTERLLQKHGHFGYRRYVSQFGSVISAYEMLGYHTSDRILRGIERDKKLRQLRSNLLLELKKLFPSQLRVVRLPGQVQRQVVELDHNVYVAIHLCRPSESTMTGTPRWVLLSQPKEKGLAALICVCDDRLDRITCFYVVPNLGDLIEGCKIIGECHPLLRSGRRLESLSEFYGVVKEMVANWKPGNGITAKGDVVFNAQTSTVTVGGCEVFLPGNAAVIFKLLVNNAGVVVSRGTLAEAVLAASQQKPKSSHRLDKHLTYHIYVLRKKLGQFRGRIVRAKGVGYTYKEGVNVNSRDQIDVQRMAKVVIRQSDFCRLNENPLPRASSTRRSEPCERTPEPCRVGVVRGRAGAAQRQNRSVFG